MTLLINQVILYYSSNFQYDSQNSKSAKITLKNIKIIQQYS